MVGKEGFVVGVDMIDGQLDVGYSFQEYPRAAFGYSASNVAFYQGYIESLRADAEITQKAINEIQTQN